MKVTYIFIFSIFFAVQLLAQSTLTLQPGSTGADAHVDDKTPNATDNAYPVFNAGYNTVGGVPTQSHNYLQFDLSAIPAGSTVLSATLSLYHSTIVNHSVSNANEELLAKVTQAWNESTITWNTQPAYSGTDTIHIGNANQGDDKTAIDLQTFVQAWVNTPAANYGMVMHLVDDPGTLGRFQSYASSDDADSLHRPKLVVTFNPPCASGTTVLQPGGATGKDAHIDTKTPDATDNAYPVFNAGYNTVGGVPTISHNLLQFDLSAIPAGATVLSATLSFTHSTIVNHSVSNANDELLAKITQPWDENTVTWNNQPAFSATDTIYIGTTNQGDDKPAINLQRFVQDWVNTPTANYGMVMHLVDEPGQLGRFQSYASSDDADSTARPKLEVEWTTCAATAVNEVEPQTPALGIYPNPVNEVLTISGLNGALVDVAVYDLLGQTLLEQKQVTYVYVKDLPAGYYLLKATKGGLSKTMRFIKQ